MDLGITFGFQGTAEDMVAKKATQLFLLAREKNLEIIKQHIAANKPFVLKGSSEEGAFEFIYILEGRIQQKTTERIMQAGDFLVIRALAEEVFFRTLSAVTLLYVTTSPIFYEEKRQIERLITIAREVEKKDSSTEDHCYRLQEIVTRLGQKLGLTDSELFHLVYAAFLHDLGKIGVPEEVLTKPGPLTDQEWEMIKEHPTLGKQMILDQLGTERFAHIAEIVAQHHERFDGKGYPSGLRGNKILLEAQILSIADAYDAMISERPYQPALAPEEVCCRLEAEKNHQFSPVVVEAFLEIEKAFRQSRNSRS